MRPTGHFLLCAAALLAIHACEDADTGNDVWEGKEPGECTDRADNDGDGLYDCAGCPDCQEETDADGDGYDSSVDCDDADPSVYPWAPEICDGQDNDCDGMVDDEDPAISDPTTWFADHDGDDFGDSASSLTGCAQPEGYTSDATDCDDVDATVNPSATEICDGEDNDCDGVVDPDSSEDAATWYADRDGDGYGDATISTAACDQPTGLVADDTDCDDTDAEVSPGGTEVCDDDIDNDCDGTADEGCGPVTWSLADSDAVIEGDSTYTYMGHGMGRAGDQDLDGIEDLFASAYCADNYGGYHSGEAYVFTGPLSGTLSYADAHATFWGEQAHDWAGIANMVEPTDINGDGNDDLVMRATQYGSGEYGLTYVVYGPASGVHSMSGSDARLLGTEYEGRARITSTVNDTDGDGYDDVLIGACGVDANGTDSGAAYLVMGPVSGWNSPEAAAGATLVAEAAEDRAGNGTGLAGDLNGDGLSDMLVGASGDDEAAADAGAVYVLLGPVSGEVSLADADAKLLGESEDDKVVSSSKQLRGGTDADGDGADDYLIGVTYADVNGEDDGAVYLVLGDVSGTWSLADASDLQLIGESPGDEAGNSVAFAGDVDGDAFTEILVGATGVDSDAGAAYLLFGPAQTGTVSLSAADIEFLAEVTGDRAGDEVAGLDLDGDGLSEVLVNAWFAEPNGQESGATYVFDATTLSP